ncbi:enoyl-CoA hydratase-related protein [Oleiagrimonas citrea]|uniref:Enoyl-CoA hydratase/isomerase family protein n=1 Tax=Oleiagrimonas citrea TaxID=1665687 RepID=A0A846ZII5_9GAMM|nr:enoyl-CoA hydratase-related protein [Oleiagrimonas citrea]NKZ37642.1 enoyl-CoA hydratase/isomerase family protein [Oleiagrimonas citrea]
MYETLVTERRDDVARITLNRPELHNAFNATLVAELTDALEAAERDPAAQAVLLTGAGPSFCAGADTRWMRGMADASEAENKEDALRLAQLLRKLNFLAKPTIARVNGAAFGGGIGLIACCDIAVGSADASFGLSEVKLGLVPATISPYVVAAIGLRHARRLFVTGETFDAAHAASIGLLHEHVVAETLDDAVEAVCKAMRRGGPLARREAKRLALRMGGMDERQAAQIDAENAELIARLRVSDEGQEGLGAFLEKRRASWRDSSSGA